MGWQMKPRKEEKKEIKIVNNNEIQHIYVETRHKENALKTVKPHRMGEKDKEVQWSSLIDCIYRQKSQ
jgi:hypothetical protein